MPEYPNLRSTLDDHDLDNVAANADVPAWLLRTILAGDVQPSLAAQERIAWALQAERRWLFQMTPTLEQGRRPEPVRDPETLRVIDALRRRLR